MLCRKARVEEVADLLVIFADVVNVRATARGIGALNVHVRSILNREGLFRELHNP
jgi:hypothetical protein